MTNKTKGFLVIMVGIISFLGILWYLLFYHPPFTNQTPQYQFVNGAELRAQEKELNGEKVCLRGSYYSGFETSSLSVDGTGVWVESLGKDEASQLHCKHNQKASLFPCEDRTTICGVLYTRSGISASPTNINGFIFENPSGYGHLGAYDFEIQGE